MVTVVFTLLFWQCRYFTEEIHLLLMEIFKPKAERLQFTKKNNAVDHCFKIKMKSRDKL